MLRSTLSLTTALWLSFGSAPANARLIEASQPVPTDAVHQAVHMPTGCSARVVLNGSAVVKAWITDRNCLPSGVEHSAIPARLGDFSFAPK